MATLRTSLNEAFRRFLESRVLSAVEHIEELESYAAAAEKLRKATDALSSKGQQAIRKHAGGSALMPTAPVLSTLVRATQAAARRAPRPTRGPHRKDRFRQLVAELGILWTVERPDAKGIGKRHGKPEGPMLEFVYRILRAQRRNALQAGRKPEATAFLVQSKAALGETLYALRRKIAECAQNERKHRTVASQIGGTRILVRGSAEDTAIPSTPKMRTASRAA